MAFKNSFFSGTGGRAGAARPGGSSDNGAEASASSNGTGRHEGELQEGVGRLVQSAVAQAQSVVGQLGAQFYEQLVAETNDVVDMNHINML